MANHNLDFERMQNSESENLDLDHYRKLVKSYIEMVNKYINHLSIFQTYFYFQQDELTIF